MTDSKIKLKDLMVKTIFKASLVIFLFGWLVPATNAWSENGAKETFSPDTQSMCSQTKNYRKKLECLENALNKLLNESEKPKESSAENKFKELKKLKELANQYKKLNLDFEKSEIEHKNEIDKIKQAYIKKIKIYEVKAGYYESVLDGVVPGVTFKLKNEGDKTLTKVVVTIYFKDVGGTIITEESYSPVSARRLLNPSSALKPGYIYQIEKGQFFPAKSVPEEWKEGSVSAKITDVDFAE